MPPRSHVRRPARTAAIGILVGVAMTGLVACSDDATDPLAAAGLEVGTSWLLASLEVDGQSVDLDEDAPITLARSDEGVAGWAGCNTYRTDVTAGGDTLFSPVAMTRKMCIDKQVMQVESTYTSELAAVTEARAQDDMLVLVSPSATMTFVADPGSGSADGATTDSGGADAASGDPGASGDPASGDPASSDPSASGDPGASGDSGASGDPVSPADLAEGPWEISSTVVGTTATAVGGDAHLEFNPDGSMLGSTGCRQVEGRWTLDGETLTITDLATFGECDATRADQDEAISAVLGTATVTRDGATVTITSGGDGLVTQVVLVGGS